VPPSSTEVSPQSAVYSPRVPACSMPYGCCEVTAFQTQSLKDVFRATVKGKNDVLCAGVAWHDCSRLTPFTAAV